MTNSQKSLILCADDFALSPAVSRGILEALSMGRLSATGAMTTQAYWKTGAQELLTLKPDADIGVHLNLTLGSPLSPMPGFCPDGNFPKLGFIIATAHKSLLPEGEIRTEIARQFDAFEHEMGRAPDFVDGHQHVQVLPQIRLWLLEEMAKRGWAGKVWLRNSGDSLKNIALRRVEFRKALLVAFFSRGFAKQARALGFAVNDSFAGFSSFKAQDYAADFNTYLEAPGVRHLVMCHPGYVDDELKALDPVTASREHELAFLLSDDFLNCVAAKGLVIGRFQPRLTPR